MLRKSLAEYGDLGAIVFNRKSKQLVGGHQRVKLLSADAKVTITRKFEKPTRVGTVAEGFVTFDDDGERFKYREVSWSKQKEMAANIAANKGAGDWDHALLTDWMKELEAFDSGFDMDLTMFDESERAGMFGTTVKEHSRTGPTGVDEDEIPEKAPARTKPGDIYVLGRHRLMCGDSTDVKAIERLMNGEKADLCFTSPPYSDLRDYGGNLKLEPSHLGQFLNAPARIFAVNLGLIKRENEIIPYWEAYFQRAKEYGLKLLSWNVWDKMQCGSVGHQTMMFPLEHEWIFIFGKSPVVLNKTEETVWGGIGKTGTTRNKDGSLAEKRPKQVVGMYKPIGSVLRHFPEKSRNRGCDHPAMFPVGFPQKYIEAMTRENGVIYDPFGGSGSTMIACEKTDRKCFMMDIDPSYCDVIIERWENFTGEKAKRVEHGKSRVKSASRSA